MSKEVDNITYCTSASVLTAASECRCKRYRWNDQASSNPTTPHVAEWFTGIQHAWCGPQTHVRFPPHFSLSLQFVLHFQRPQLAATSHATLFSTKSPSEQSCQIHRSTNPQISEALTTELLCTLKITHNINKGHWKQAKPSHETKLSN